MVDARTAANWVWFWSMCKVAWSIYLGLSEGEGGQCAFPGMGEVACTWLLDGIAWLRELFWGVSDVLLGVRKGCSSRVAWCFCGVAVILT